MITFITDTRAGELPFNESVFQNNLLITDLEGVEICTKLMPANGWTHEQLERLAVQLDDDVRYESIRNGTDAYLDDDWVGSTEV